MPLDSVPFLTVLTVPLSLASPTIFLRAHSIALSMSLMKILSTLVPIQTPRDSTCHRSPSRHRAFDHYCLDATIQSLPYPPNRAFFKSISLQVREKYVVAHYVYVKGLTEVQRDNTSSSAGSKKTKHLSRNTVIETQASVI